MARIQQYKLTLALGASHTVAAESNQKNLGDGEFSRFAVYFPTSGLTDCFITETVDITFQGSMDGGTTWHTIGYSNNPSTATSGFKAADVGQDSWGSAVICEAALFTKDFRIKFSSATTQATELVLVAGKE